MTVTGTAKTPDGYYIWRTVEDDRVRSNHAAYNRTVRAWSDEPDPGEEFNCRCRAEANEYHNPHWDHKSSPSSSWDNVSINDKPAHKNGK